MGKSSNGRRAAGVDGRRTSARATSTATDDRQGSDGASVTSAAAEIREREHPFWRVVAPILAIVCCLVLFSVFTKYFSVDCSNYFMLKLVYPLFFGAAGAVLGGAVSVSGQFKILGHPWTMQAVGAVGAAVIGFAISTYAEPKCAVVTIQPKQALHITNIPMNRPSSNGRKSKIFYRTAVQCRQQARRCILRHLRPEFQWRQGLHGRSARLEAGRRRWLPKHRNVRGQISSCEATNESDT